jgi:hypothetical protein
VLVCAELIKWLAAVSSTSQLERQTHAFHNQELLAVRRLIWDLGLGIWDLGVGTLHSGCQQLRRDRDLVRKRLQRGVLTEMQRGRPVTMICSAMNLLALDMPHLKVAGVKFVYSCDQKMLKHGFCEALCMKHVRDLMVKHSDVAKQAETVLNFFHGQCTRHCGYRSPFEML